jgi:hypothetical protein
MSDAVLCEETSLDVKNRGRASSESFFIFLGYLKMSTDLFCVVPIFNIANVLLPSNIFLSLDTIDKMILYVKYFLRTKINDLIL